MRAQLLFGMLFMLAVSISFILALAALYAGVFRDYSSGSNLIGAYYARSSNALARETLPYGEFHVIRMDDR